jgi:hypothetical protein
VRPIVTFLTDFGHRDPFVGIMKGVVLGLCPDAQLVDLCHEVPAYDTLGASFVLHTAVGVFPPGTVHVVVVDPGVGGPRRPILAEVDGQRYVAPDNGILSYPMATARAARTRHLTAPEFWRHPVSASFHGRDLFAPVAGHLAAGVDPARLGPEIGDPVRLDLPPLRCAPGALSGRVMWVDRFGNCITNIRQEEIAACLAAGRPDAVRVSVAGRPVGPMVGTFGDLPVGGTGAIRGSAGYLELVCNQGNLSREWQVTAGDPVHLEGPPPV